MAGVAATGTNHIASGYDDRSVWHEIEGGGRITGAQFEQRQIARPISADRVGGGCVETARRFRRECVLVDSGRFQSERTAGIRRCLDRRIARYRAFLNSRYVGDVLLLAMWNCGHHHADRDGSRRSDSGPVEGLTFQIGDRYRGCDRAIGGDVCAENLERKTGPGDRGSRRVTLFPRGTLVLLVRTGQGERNRSRHRGGAPGRLEPFPFSGHAARS